MIHSAFLPCPALAPYVELLWFASRYEARSRRERVLPDGALALVIHLGEQPLYLYGEQSTVRADSSGAVLCGARQTPMIIGTAMGPTVGVHFKPGGARPFFDARADELAEECISLDAIWGRTASLLREQISESTPHARIQLLEHALLARLRPGDRPAPALSLSLAAFDEPELTSVAEVNRRTGYSPKRLAALFHEHIGLSPKAYWRVRRFRAVLRDLERGAQPSSQLAAEHGYYDQAHFIREFQAIAGSSPTAYMAARIPGTDHVSVFG